MIFQVREIAALKLELNFTQEAADSFDVFIRKQVKLHHEGECEFPGYVIEVAYHPALGYDINVRVGSASCALDGVHVSMAKPKLESE